MRLLIIIITILTASACCFSSSEYTSEHPLTSAVRMQDTAAVISVLNCPNNPKISPKTLSDALYYAITLGNAGLTDMLINRSAPINTPIGPENRKMPPLAWAVCLEDQAMVKLLIAHHADRNIIDYNNIPLISLAAWSGDLEIFKAVSKNMDIKARYLISSNRVGSLLHAAAEASSLELTQYLIEHGLNLQSTDSQNKTVLQAAVAGQNLKVVELIVNAGAMLAVCDMETQTEKPAVKNHKTLSSKKLKTDTILVKPVSLKSITGQKMAAELLAKYTNSDFHRAVIQKDLKTVKEMIKSGQNVNQLDNLSATPLMYAALLGQTQTVELLTGSKADINKPGARGATPLHMAVFAGQNQVVTLLIANGADTYAENYARITPLQMAQNANASEIVKMIHSARSTTRNSTDNKEPKPQNPQNITEEKKPDSAEKNKYSKTDTPKPSCPAGLKQVAKRN